MAQFSVVFNCSSVSRLRLLVEAESRNEACATALSAAFGDLVDPDIEDTEFVDRWETCDLDEDDIQIEVEREFGECGVPDVVAKPESELVQTATSAHELMSHLENRILDAQRGVA